MLNIDESTVYTFTGTKFIYTNVELDQGQLISFRACKNLCFISGTFAFKSPSPIEVDANIKLFIDLKNLEENLIAIEIDMKSSKVTTIM